MATPSTTNLSAAKTSNTKQMRFNHDVLRAAIAEDIAKALKEDMGEQGLAGDLTVQLIDAQKHAQARIITREHMVLAGRPWVEALFASIDNAVKLNWFAADGEYLKAGATLLELEGNARSLMSGERIALNFMQTLSGIATKVSSYAELIKDLPTKLLDTRKTIPGLRIAQKYAVVQGGGYNHRIGLYDQFLIKENHIAACGGIAGAIARARLIAPDVPVEVEVETFAQLSEALAAGADIVMLDNFTAANMTTAVKQVAGRCLLEASGDVTKDNLREVAATGVDYVSMGALTKHVRAVDLSMRVI